MAGGQRGYGLNSLPQSVLILAWFHEGSSNGLKQKVENESKVMKQMCLCYDYVEEVLER